MAAPAAAAALAYLNARTSFGYDYMLFKAAFKSLCRVLLRQRAGRLSVFYNLEERARHPCTANKDLLIFDGRKLTYAQVYDKALRHGAWMRDTLGVKPNHVVSMDFENSDTFILVWLGLWSIGAKPAFINYNLTGKSLSHCIKAAKSSICLVDPNVAKNITDQVRNELSQVNFVVFTPDVKAQVDATAPRRVPDSDLHQDDFANLAILIYTSGTTGLPKPAVVSWAKIIAGGTTSETLLARGGNDIMYTVGTTRDHPLPNLHTEKWLIIVFTVHAALPLVSCLAFLLLHHIGRQHTSPRPQVLHQAFLEGSQGKQRDNDPIRRRDAALPAGSTP